MQKSRCDNNKPIVQPITDESIDDGFNYILTQLLDKSPHYPPMWYVKQCSEVNLFEETPKFRFLSFIKWLITCNDLWGKKFFKFFGPNCAPVNIDFSVIQT